MANEATADQILLGLSQEVTWGTDPGGTRQLLRLTGESLGPTEENVESAEITGDRQVRDLLRTSFQADGDTNFEMSADAFDDIFQGALMHASGLGDNGTTQNSYTLEREYQDGGVSGESSIFTGMMINTMSFTVAPGAIIAGSIGWIGKDYVNGTGMTLPTAAPTKKVLNSINDVSALNEGGGAVNLLELTIDLNNNLRARPEIGSLSPVNVALGTLQVSGRLRAYYRSATLFDKFKAETESSLDITIDDAGGEGYTFTMPRVRFGSARRVAGGRDSDIIVEMDWTALRKTTANNHTINIVAVP